MVSESAEILNGLALMANFVFVPAIAYASQLALGALAVTLIYSILRMSNFNQGDSPHMEKDQGTPTSQQKFTY